MTNLSNEAFDALFKQALGLERFANSVGKHNRNASAFPPYNIIVDQETNPTKFTIEMAVAGFSRDQLTVKVSKETGMPVLIVEGEKNEQQNDRIYTHHGLANRSFTRRFTISNDMRVSLVRLVDGMLIVNLEVTRPTDTEVTVPIN